MAEAGARGRLLVVGTPIGNLGDLTPRAAEALRTADLVVAEDTRLAARLLAHIGARTPTLSFNDHNATTRLPELLRRLGDCQTLALTTDAGMPAISDPGARLVAAARQRGAGVEVVPGPAAVTAAFAIAGVEAPGFVFGGFLPARPATARANALARLIDAAGDAGLPLILYEAPHRMRSLVDAVSGASPDCRLAVARELTKRHEEVVVGSPTEVAAALRASPPRGEYTVVIHALQVRPPDAPFDAGALTRAARDAGLTDRGVVDLLRAAGLPRREAYRRAREPR